MDLVTIHLQQIRQFDDLWSLQSESQACDYSDIDVLMVTHLQLRSDIYISGCMAVTWVLYMQLKWHVLAGTAPKAEAGHIFSLLWRNSVRSRPLITRFDNITYSPIDLHPFDITETDSPCWLPWHIAPSLGVTSKLYSKRFVSNLLGAPSVQAQTYL